MEEDAASQFASPHAACYFFRIPKEIRLEIYRYLLLPTLEIYVSGDKPSLNVPDRIADMDHGFEHYSDDGLGDEYGDGWEDETDNDSDMDSMMSEMMHEADIELFGDDDNEDDDEESSDDSEDTFDEDDDEDFKRDLAILRTNKQIHSEAISIFYSEGILMLEPGDIFSLVKNPNDLEFGLPNEVAWKHNPLNGIGTINEDDLVVYNTAPLTGDIEPHVFAKFQRISFDGYFDDDHTQPFEMWIDDDTHVVRAQDAANFKKILQSSNLMKDLAKILSNSPRITSLEIALEVEVIANSNLIMEDMMEDSEDEDSDAEDKTEKIMEIANEKATEIFLDSGIMEPLKILSNVSSCDFKFGFEHRDEGDEYKPPAKYVGILRDLKDTIENNFKEATLES